VASLRGLLEHCAAMAGAEQDESLRAQWAAMAEEIRAYLNPTLPMGEPLPGL